MNNIKGRPRLLRKLNIQPKADYFKPRGVPVSSLKIVELTYEELEALKLKNIQGLDQRACAKKMNTSPATIQRILSSAYQKISQALVNGQAIKISKEF